MFCFVFFWTNKCTPISVFIYICTFRYSFKFIHTIRRFRSICVILVVITVTSTCGACLCQHHRHATWRWFWRNFLLVYHRLPVLCTWVVILIDDALQGFRTRATILPFTFYTALSRSKYEILVPLNSSHLMQFVQYFRHRLRKAFVLLTQNVRRGVSGWWRFHRYFPKLAGEGAFDFAGRPLYCSCHCFGTSDRLSTASKLSNLFLGKLKKWKCTSKMLHLVLKRR